MEGIKAEEVVGLEETRAGLEGTRAEEEAGLEGTRDGLAVAAGMAGLDVGLDWVECWVEAVDCVETGCVEEGFAAALAGRAAEMCFFSPESALRVASNSIDTII